MMFKDRYEGDKYDTGIKAGKILQYGTGKTIEIYLSIAIRTCIKKKMYAYFNANGNKILHDVHVGLFIVIGKGKHRARRWYLQEYYVRRFCGRYYIPTDHES